MDFAFDHRQSSGAGIRHGLAGDRRWSNGLLSRYRRLSRSAFVRARQCLWIRRARGLHAVSGQTGRAYRRRQLKSSVAHRNLQHLGRRARLPYGATGWCAETQGRQIADPIGSVGKGGATLPRTSDGPGREGWGCSMEGGALGVGKIKRGNCELTWLGSCSRPLISLRLVFGASVAFASNQGPEFEDGRGARGPLFIANNKAPA